MIHIHISLFYNAFPNKKNDVKKNEFKAILQTLFVR